MEGTEPTGNQKTGNQTTGNQTTEKTGKQTIVPAQAPSEPSPGVIDFSKIYSKTYCDSLLNSIEYENKNEIYSETNLNGLKANTEIFLKTFIEFQVLLNKNISSITEYLKKFNKSPTSNDSKPGTELGKEPDQGTNPNKPNPTGTNSSNPSNTQSGGGKLKRKQTKKRQYGGSDGARYYMARNEAKRQWEKSAQTQKALNELKKEFNFTKEEWLGVVGKNSTLDFSYPTHSTNTGDGTPGLSNDPNTSTDNTPYKEVVETIFSNLHASVAILGEQKENLNTLEKNPIVQDFLTTFNKLMEKLMDIFPKKGYIKGAMKSMSNTFSFDKYYKHIPEINVILYELARKIDYVICKILQLSEKKNTVGGGGLFKLIRKKHTKKRKTKQVGGTNNVTPSTTPHNTQPNNTQPNTQPNISKVNNYEDIKGNFDNTGNILYLLIIVSDENHRKKFKETIKDFVMKGQDESKVIKLISKYINHVLNFRKLIIRYLKSLGYNKFEHISIQLNDKTFIYYCLSNFIELFNSKKIINFVSCPTMSNYTKLKKEWPIIMNLFNIMKNRIFLIKVLFRIFLFIAGKILCGKTIGDLQNAGMELNFNALSPKSLMTTSPGELGEQIMDKETNEEFEKQNPDLKEEGEGKEGEGEGEEEEEELEEGGPEEVINRIQSFNNASKIDKGDLAFLIDMGIDVEKVRKGENTDYINNVMEKLKNKNTTMKVQKNEKKANEVKPKGEEAEEAKKAEAEAEAKAEEARRQAEEAKAEEARKAREEEEARKAREEEEARRQAEEAKAKVEAEEERKKQEEERKRQEAEAKAEEAKKAEEARRQAEEAKAKAEEERKAREAREAEEAKAEAEKKAREAEEAKAKADAEAKEAMKAEEENPKPQQKNGERGTLGRLMSLFRRKKTKNTQPSTNTSSANKPSTNSAPAQQRRGVIARLKNRLLSRKKTTNQTRPANNPTPANKQPTNSASQKNGTRGPFARLRRMLPFRTKKKRTNQTTQSANIQQPPANKSPASKPASANPTPAPVANPAPPTNQIPSQSANPTPAPNPQPSNTTPASNPENTTPAASNPTQTESVVGGGKREKVRKPHTRRKRNSKKKTQKRKQNK